MRSLKKYYNTEKSFYPYLKFRYSEGLGDAISAFLHSKYIGPITYLITGNIDPCEACNNRRIALNILFPIPFWKLFFKTREDYQNSIDEEYRKYGVVIKDAVENTSDDEEDSSCTGDCGNCHKSPEPPEPEKIWGDELDPAHYRILNSSITQNGDILVRVSFYKKKESYD